MGRKYDLFGLTTLSSDVRAQALPKTSSGKLLTTSGRRATATEILYRALLGRSSSKARAPCVIIHLTVCSCSQSVHVLTTSKQAKLLVRYAFLVQISGIGRTMIFAQFLHKN